jgi:hypothetical protein
MLLTVDDDPSIIGSAMRGAVNIVNSGDEAASRREKCLPICEDLSVNGRSYNPVEIVICNDFYQPRIAIGKSDAQGQDLMAAVRTPVLRTRRTDGHAANHDVVHAAGLIRTEEVVKFLIDLWVAILRRRNVLLRNRKGGGKPCQ